MAGGNTGRIERMRRAVSFPQVDIKSARILILAAVVALVAIGIVTVYSATSATLASEGENPFTDAIRQLAYVGIGVLVMVGVWFAFPYQSWMGGVLLYGYYAFCMVLLVLTFTIGTEVNGARRWLFIGPIGFQPSEFIKIALMLMTIRIVHDREVEKMQLRAAFTQFAGFVAVPLAFMLFTQSDLGTVAICFVGIFAVLWLGGVSGRYLLLTAAAVLVGGIVMILGVGYRSSRMVFLNPWDDGEGGLGAGYNIIHAYYAIAEGGLFGQGIGSSNEKFGYLFASDSDFIFAIICEEMGMVGAVIVIALFLVILFAGLKIAADCIDDYGKMIAGGLAVMLVFQAFLNIGCTIGVFPTTGKPLPFISSGGSSVISSLMVIGFILSVSRSTERMTDPNRQRDNLRVIRNTGGNPGTAAPRSQGGASATSKIGSPHETSGSSYYNPGGRKKGRR